MIAEVAMNLFLSSLKAAIVIPLIAPPVPSSPALKPDKVPPKIAFFILATTANLLKIKNNKLETIKNKPNT